VLTEWGNIILSDVQLQCMLTNNAMVNYY